jgi:hypothetical protein
MVFHGELANLKPSPRHLTSFYLHIAAGGAFGTVLVGLVAPHLLMLNRPASEGATSSENRRLRIGVVGLGVGTPSRLRGARRLYAVL